MDGVVGNNLCRREGVGMDELVLTIRGECHPSLNLWDREYWKFKTEEKARWYWLIRGALGVQIGAGPFTDVFIEYHFPDIIHRDHDNYTPKFILDALKRWGLIEDDSARKIDVDWKIVFNAEEKKTVIILRK